MNGTLGRPQKLAVSWRYVLTVFSEILLFLLDETNLFPHIPDNCIN